MSTFFIIIFEILVRLLILALCLVGAYYLFRGMKSSHPILGTLIGILAIAVTVNIFIPSSYTPASRLTFKHHLTADQKAAAHSHSTEKAKEAETKSLEEARESSRQAHQRKQELKKQKTGLYGLKYQVNKAMKGNAILTYKVKVMGVDSSKPYTANIFLQDKDAAGFKYGYAKSDAVTIMKGIKKANYQDFSKIGIIFTGDTVDKTGNKNSNTPLVKYRFTSKRISEINPDNMQSLTSVANYYWKSDISE
ncbi:hypothetical protein ACFQ44_05750 [Levilactobacillus lanxiensis]|uniref:DUF4811 domain-containing protein n=1 Tax=Levilactobacillus lanxiensis TaxID=2799568 RepID=A0ABW4D2M4_9LACO|nr:hypothetical protein [Levilactobacillus lanxiensis]